ncbi:PAR4 protein, partial [Urocolius indicus]|nr:PAR4 protein [Urocolius indicus]
SYHLLGNRWLFGDYLCRVTVASFYGNMYGSILFLTCVGLERYVSVTRPFLWKGSNWTKGKAAVCLGVWLAVGLGVSPLLLQPQTVHVGGLNVTTCHDVLARDQQAALAVYFLCLVGLGFALPFALTAVSYGCILARLRAKGRRYRKVVRVLVLVLLAFLISFTPSNVLLFIHYLPEPTGCHNITYARYALALALGAFNNCFDPFIYFYASQDFRSWLRAAGSCCCCCWGQATSSSSSSGRVSKDEAASPPRSSQHSQ